MLGTAKQAWGLNFLFVFELLDGAGVHRANVYGLVVGLRQKPKHALFLECALTSSGDAVLEGDDHSGHELVFDRLPHVITKRSDVPLCLQLIMRAAGNPGRLKIFFTTTLLRESWLTAARME